MPFERRPHVFNRVGECQNCGVHRTRALGFCNWPATHVDPDEQSDPEISRTNPVRFCRDCRHAQQTLYRDNSNPAWLCTRPDPGGPNLVTGELPALNRDCNEERYGLTGPGVDRCERGARYFEAIVGDVESPRVFSVEESSALSEGRRMLLEQAGSAAEVRVDQEMINRERLALPDAPTTDAPTPVVRSSRRSPVNSMRPTRPAMPATGYADIEAEDQ